MKDFHFLGETQILNDNLRSSAPGCFVELSSGIAHYEFEGPESGQIVVLIHGFSIPFQIWDTIYTPLVEAGFRVLRYDLFGRGYSDRPRIVYDQNLFDQQLFDMLNVLEVDRPVDLIGLSMGGAISVGFCHRHPELVRKFVLIDPSGFPVNTPKWANLIKAPIIGELLLSIFGERYLISSLAEDFYKAEKYPEYINFAREQMKIRGYRGALLSTFRHDMLADLSEIYHSVGKQGIPSCLIWGVEDKTIPFETNMLVRKAIPDIAFHPIENAGHVPHYEYPEQVISILIAFLATDS
jgi:pimeloyl-ACP methyl ester carboxylesterase